MWNIFNKKKKEDCYKTSSTKVLNMYENHCKSIIQIIESNNILNDENIKEIYNKVGGSLWYHDFYRKEGELN